MDSSARLDALVQAGMITRQAKELASATAAAARGLSSALPALRTLADADDTAATKMIDLLIAAGQLDDAQTAALSAYSRFTEPAFLVQAAELLMRLGLDGDGQQPASEAVGQSGLDAVSRQAAHWVLAATAITAAEAAGSTVTAMQSWRRAEHHLAECVGAADGLPANPRDVWNLIHVQMKLGDLGRAHATLLAGTPEVFARMLDLADRFGDDPQFSGMLLSAVVARHATRAKSRPHPLTRAWNWPRISGPRHSPPSRGTPRGTATQAPSGCSRGFPPRTSWPRCSSSCARITVRYWTSSRGSARCGSPFGMLATMISRPYSSTLAQRALGYFISGTSNDADDQADEGAAAAARNSDIVVDASAPREPGRHDATLRARNALAGQRHASPPRRLVRETGEPEGPELECRPQLSIGCCRHRHERCVGGVLEITVGL